MNAELDLKDSFLSIDTTDFLSVLQSELERESDCLPLEDFCNRGGWPDSDTLEVDVKETLRSEMEVRVKVTISFLEAIPTGCADINRSNIVVGEIEIVFDRGASIAYVLDFGSE